MQKPLDAKFALAAAVVEGYHGPEAAVAARAEYDRVHKEGGVPDDLPEWSPDENTRLSAPSAIRRRRDSPRRMVSA